MRVQTQRGFTLLEIAIALAIVTILAALSFAALGAMKKRASYTNVTTEAAMAVRRMRAEALGRGVSTVFVVDTMGGRWWGLEAPAAGFTLADLDAFDPDAPGEVIASGTLPEDVKFGPTAHLPALPAPFAGVPMTSSQAPTFTFCSFCRDTGSNKGFGGVVFSSNGTASFLGAPNAVGHQFSLRGTQDALTRTFTVAIIGRSGVVEVFEDES
jgi:prepilin-type N-terminal cleavage/methylation domain-containing protein